MEIDMPKGGARTRSGPPPDPNALARERDAGEWTILPASGRAGDPPEWPLMLPVDRELELWARLWGKPQALMWERLGLEFEVAMYVRRLAEAEAAESSVSLSTLVRQMSDSLGLTTPGMRANRWKIEQVADVAPATDRPTRESARDRLRVVGADDDA
jgi:hypothetical protein